MYTSGENSELAAKQIRSWERQQKEEYRRKKEEIRKKLNSPHRAATSEAVNTDEAENLKKRIFLGQSRQTMTISSQSALKINQLPSIAGKNRHAMFSLHK